MKKIYLIGHDPNYASITVEETSDSTDISNLQADPITNFKQPTYRLADSNTLVGNFVYLNDTALVFDDKTERLMGDFIEYASQGEMHQLDVEAVGSLQLLNVVETINPINNQVSEWVPGSWKDTIAMNKLVFHPQRVGTLSSLFKIPELNYQPILCYSGFTDEEEYPQDHDFHAFYHENAFTGLLFTEIWSDC